MTKASDNAYPSILITEGTEPSAPAAGKQRLYIDSTTHKLKRTDSSGTDVTIESTSGAVATDTIWDAAGDLAIGTGADTAAKLTIGAAGTALVSNGTTASWTRAKGALVDFGFAKRTSGDITLNNTSWTTTGITDLTLTAASGDIVEVGVSGLMANEAVNAALDAVSIVSAAPVNYFGASGGGSDLGVQSWLGLSGVSTDIAGSIMYTLQAGDITAGTVVVRLMYRTTAASAKTLRSSATQPFHWWVKNLGAAI